MQSFFDLNIIQENKWDWVSFKTVTHGLVIQLSGHFEYTIFSSCYHSITRYQIFLEETFKFPWRPSHRRKPSDCSDLSLHLLSCKKIKEYLLDYSSICPEHIFFFILFFYCCFNFFLEILSPWYFLMKGKINYSILFFEWRLKMLRFSNGKKSCLINGAGSRNITHHCCRW